MRTIVKGKNIEVPDRVRAYAERKLKRLERMLDDRSDALVELSVEQHRSAVGLPHRRGDARHRRSAAPDACRRGQPPRRRRRGRRQARAPRGRPSREAAGPRPARGGEADPAPDRRRDVDDGREHQIVKTKRFAIEPMFEEDAATRMEELGHQFFVFVNAENERINVLYRRSDGDLGLIEPVDRRRLHARRLEGRPALERPALTEATVPRLPPPSTGAAAARPATDPVGAVGRHRRGPPVDPGLARHEPAVDEVAAQRRDVADGGAPAAG